MQPIGRSDKSELVDSIMKKAAEKKVGRKDLAQRYYQKIAAQPKAKEITSVIVNALKSKYSLDNIDNNDFNKKVKSLSKWLSTELRSGISYFKEMNKFPSNFKPEFSTNYLIGDVGNFYVQMSLGSKGINANSHMIEGFSKAFIKQIESYLLKEYDDKKSFRYVTFDVEEIVVQYAKGKFPSFKFPKKDRDGILYYVRTAYPLNEHSEENIYKGLVEIEKRFEKLNSFFKSFKFSSKDFEALDKKIAEQSKLVEDILKEGYEA